MFGIALVGRLPPHFRPMGAVDTCEDCIPGVRKDSTLDLDDGDRSDYRAVGKIDFFGEGAFTRVGGGGLAWTERLQVRFQWLSA
jgi:hypothetical protein